MQHGIDKSACASATAIGQKIGGERRSNRVVAGRQAFQLRLHLGHSRFSLCGTPERDSDGAGRCRDLGPTVGQRELDHPYAEPFQSLAGTQG